MNNYTNRDLAALVAATMADVLMNSMFLTESQAEFIFDNLTEALQDQDREYIESYAVTIQLMIEKAEQDFVLYGNVFGEVDDNV